MVRFFGSTLLASVALLLILSVASSVLPEIARENGMLENLQSIFLAGALAALLARSRHWRPASDCLGFFFSLALLTMLLRELDFHRFDLPAWLISLGDGFGRNLLLGLLWLAFLVLAAGKRQHLGGWIRQGLGSRWGWTLLLGGGFYLLGLPFDKKIFPLEKTSQLFWEEAMETVAALYIGLGILRWLTEGQLKRLANEPHDRDLGNAVHR